MPARRKQQKVTDAEIIEEIRRIPEPFATASELAEQLQISRQRINERLRRLEERGIVDRKSAGSGQGWWISTYPDCVNT